MNPKSLQIKIVSFGEHPIVDFAQTEPTKFDISAIGLNYPSSFIINDNFSMEVYCEALLSKATMLCKSEILDFLEYQCSKMKKPTDWLTYLESLIDINSVYFDDDCKISKLQKLDVNIQVLRANLKHIPKPLKKQLVNWAEILAPVNLVKFDFCLVKFDLEKLDSYTTKKAYLIELKADYLQAKEICPISANKSFGSLIDIELERLEQLQLIPIAPSNLKIDPNKQGSKLRITGNANILIDIFHRLLYEFMPEGKPFIDNTPTEVANVIVENFTNKDGKSLSLNTVQTTLSPGKIDKRPSCDKRFCMRHLIQPSIILCNMYMIDYMNIIDIFPMLN